MDGHDGRGKVELRKADFVELAGLVTFEHVADLLFRNTVEVFQVLYFVLIHEHEDSDSGELVVLIPV